MAWYLPGVPMLIGDLAALAAAIAALWQASLHPGGMAVALVWAGAILLVAAVLGFRGEQATPQVVNTGTLYS